MLCRVLTLHLSLLLFFSNKIFIFLSKSLWKNIKELDFRNFSASSFFQHNFQWTLLRASNRHFIGLPETHQHCVIRLLEAVLTGIAVKPIIVSLYYNNPPPHPAADVNMQMHPDNPIHPLMTKLSSLFKNIFILFYFFLHSHSDDDGN
jgi:hypothetical protein